MHVCMYVCMYVCVHAEDTAGVPVRSQVYKQLQRLVISMAGTVRTDACQDMQKIHAAVAASNMKANVQRKLDAKL